MFYVFRYTILKHPAIRYLLAPIYLACGWAAYLSLCPIKPTHTPTPTSKTTPQTTPPQPQQSENTVSTVLLLLLPTTLSLITAPLVEPRYFILPWIFYRLNLPKGQAHRWLWLETFWFLVINVGTGYMFLYRGFEWQQEKGLVQRFMW
jgi:alpha-1,2-glucosyltransferase